MGHFVAKIRDGQAFVPVSGDTSDKNVRELAIVRFANGSDSDILATHVLLRDGEHEIWWPTATP